MNKGYTEPLYLLPFDHRHSYLSGMFDLAPPLAPDAHERVADSKRVIYAGFLQAVAGGAPQAAAGILVDEEFGSDILRDASARGFVTAVSTEKSGCDEFEFEYGSAFAEHIHHFAPTFAKALVRYNPAGDAQLNLRQQAKLKQLSDSCRDSGPRFMFELLVPPTAAQLESVGGDTDTYDSQLRPALVVQTLEALQDAGVEPDVWKIEGLENRGDCERIVATARRGGRSTVGCIVLGHGADEKKVVGWLATAAPVDGFIGFAVGRTTFWDAIADYEAKRATREEAAGRIGQRYREWIAIFEQARHNAPARAG